MKKIIWVIIGLAVVIAILFIVFNRFFNQNLTAMFSILYGFQFLLALIFLSILDKSKKQLYTALYFIIAVVVFALLFFKMF